MNARKALQTLLVGLLMVLSVSASEPSYCYAPTCSDGNPPSSCDDPTCQRWGRVFGSYIRVCIFEVQVCHC